MAVPVPREERQRYGLVDAVYGLYRGEGDADPDEEADGHADPETDRDAKTDGHADAETHGDAEADSHTDSEGDADAHAGTAAVRHG